MRVMTQSPDPLARMHTMTEKKRKSGTIDVKALLAGDEEFLRALVRTALEEVLEAEMTEALGAEKGERTAGRLGYRLQSARSTPQHLLLAIAIEREGNINRLIAHQPVVADLDPQRVEKDYRIKRVERPVLPFPNLIEYCIGNPADQIGRDLDAIQLVQMRLDLAHRKPAAREADAPVVKALDPGLVFGNNLRLEAAVTVARHGQIDRPVIADHGFARIAVPAVAAAPAGWIALLVSQMLG